MTAENSGRMCRFHKSLWRQINTRKKVTKIKIDEEMINTATQNHK